MVEIIYEELCYSDYEVRKECKSLIDPSNTIWVDIGTHCPSCKKMNPTIEHGETITCSCGLKMQVFGNCLQCTKIDYMPKLLGKAVKIFKTKLLKGD